MEKNIAIYNEMRAAFQRAADHGEPVEPDNIEPGTTPAAPPLILIL